VSILNDGRALGREGLDADFVGHWPPARFEKRFDVGNRFGVFVERFAEEFCNQVTRDIVRGRAKAASGNDKVGAAERFANGGFNVNGVIGYGDLTVDYITGICELAAEPLLVGVEDAAEHQLRAGVD
jgi:hypothetical protein